MLPVCDPREEKDRQRQNQEGTHDPRHDRDPGLAQRPAGAAVAGQADGVDPGAPFSKYAAIAANGPIAAGAGPHGRGSAMDAAGVPVLVVELQLPGHAFSLPRLREGRGPCK